MRASPTSVLPRALPVLLLAHLDLPNHVPNAPKKQTEIDSLREKVSDLDQEARYQLANSNAKVQELDGRVSRRDDRIHELESENQVLAGRAAEATKASSLSRKTSPQRPEQRVRLAGRSPIP